MNRELESDLQSSLGRLALEAGELEVDSRKMAEFVGGRLVDMEVYNPGLFDFVDSKAKAIPESEAYAYTYAAALTYEAVKTHLGGLGAQINIWAEDIPLEEEKTAFFEEVLGFLEKSCLSLYRFFEDYTQGIGVKHGQRAEELFIEAFTDVAVPMYIYFHEDAN